MRRLSFIACCILALACAYHGYRNEPVDGVDKMAWETSLRDVKGVALTERYPGNTIYLDPLDGYCDDCKTYARLDSVEEATFYLGCHGALCAKMTILDGQSEQEALASLVATYGEPTREETGSYNGAFWAGKKVDVELRTGGLMGGAPLRIYAYKPLLLRMKIRHDD